MCAPENIFLFGAISIGWTYHELQTYENNLGFLTSTSKKGSSLLTELNRKVDKLKADLELVLQKIKVIDESIKAEE